MKIFLDTSSLFKLYHREPDTEELERLFTDNTVNTIYLSEISKTEYSSTVWKKVRTKGISEAEALITIKLFELDFAKFTFIVTDSIVIEQARILISKYGARGLRTLDSIQLSTALSLSHQADLFITADKLLNSFFEAEGLQT